ncbi:chitin deacetylase [Geranomyces variabilis]|uniref:Chitin deacetylase n=1 Tax=Geranomyces variabilis TaxID=109894 RepID=A0AAD5XRD3_9FUNG|nr:chitin deacetylase [Geranomyces variabilis]
MLVAKALVLLSSVPLFVLAQASGAAGPSPVAAAAPAAATRTANIAPANPAPQVAGAFPSMPAGMKMVDAAKNYPNMPTSWPDPDEAKGPISLPALLSAPLVQAGVAKVTGIVSPTLLSVKPSIRIGYQSEVTYQDDPTLNCYWPSVQCHKPVTQTPYLQPDVVSCIDANTLGLPTQGNQTTMALGQKLKGMNLAATFFVTGGASYFNPDALQALFAEGHEIAVHTWTHAPMTSLTTEQIVAEILYTEAFIYALIGQRPRYFRPPYGDVDDRVRAIVGALGYESVMWQEAKDLQDQSATAASSPASSFVATFNSWMTPQPGYIDLEHSLLAPVNGFAAAILDDFAARKAAGLFVPNALPVGQCQKKSSYVPLGYVLGSADGATTSSSGAAPGVTGTAGASSPKASAMPTRAPSVDNAAGPASAASSVVGLLAAAAVLSAGLIL